MNFFLDETEKKVALPKEEMSIRTKGCKIGSNNSGEVPNKVKGAENFRVKTKVDLLSLAKTARRHTLARSAASDW